MKMRMFKTAAGAALTLLSRLLPTNHRRSGAPEKGKNLPSLLNGSEPWLSIIARWTRLELPIRPGVTQASIDAFEKQYNVVLPRDFAEYLKAVDGTTFNESDENVLSFLSLAEIRPVHAFLDESGGVVYPDRFAYPDCFVFADYLISSWLYAVEITSNSASLGPVYRVTASDIPGPLEATSFREFMTRYAHAPESVIG